MGESAVGILKNEHKMGETASSSPMIEVSISFGRFENEALSWEKWSTFSPNKYLEEVEKCATPGSVAQKKAYFEAHYKKIAARKAELLEQENQLENSQLKSFEENEEDLRNTLSEIDSELHESRNLDSSEEIKREISSNGEVGESNRDAVEEVVDSKLECQITLVDEKEVVDGKSVHSNIYKSDEAVMESPSPVTEDLPRCMDVKKIGPKLEEKVTVDGKSVHSNTHKSEEAVMENEVREKVVVDGKSVDSNTHKSEEAVMENEVEPPSPLTEDLPSCMDVKKIAPELKQKVVVSDHAKESRKVTPASKDKYSGSVKKKPVKTTSKESQIHITPRTSKASSGYMTPKTRSSAKKSNESTLFKSKIASEGQGRKVAAKSLHMSLSLGSPNSYPASLSTGRKSLIMEKMADKDIVKRAFKTFQSSFNQMKSSHEERSVVGKQVPVKGTEPRVSTSINQRKENGGSLKAGGVDKRDTKAIAASHGLKINETIDRQKEFSKKLDKPSWKDSERAGLQLKAKNQKEAEIKKLRQSFNFKATPMPAFYRMQKLSKSSLDKEVPKL